MKCKKLRKLIEKENKAVNEKHELISIRKRSLMSKGELRIAEFLKDNGIQFYREFFFKELLVKGRSFFYDFYIPDYNLCIEFDGQQHYTKQFNGKKLKNIEKNDFLKTAFCKKKGINILRIKYSDLENIETIICKYFDKKF